MSPAAGPAEAQRMARGRWLASWRSAIRLAWRDARRHKGGSHCVFVRADGRTLPVPARRPIKPVYIRMFLVLVDGE